MKILSIQSAVAYGHVGNSAAVFPLQLSRELEGGLIKKPSIDKFDLSAN